MPLRTFLPCTLAALALLAGCEGTVDVTLPPHAPRLVVQGAIAPGQAGWEVVVTHSVGVLDPTDVGRTFVPDAHVEVFEVEDDGRERSVAVLTYAGGRYRSDAPPPVPGRTYRLVVAAPGYGTATAVDRVPEAVTVTDVTLGGAAPVPGGAPVEGRLHLAFQDPAAQANHYRLYVSAAYGHPHESGVDPEIEGALGEDRVRERLDVLRDAFGEGSGGFPALAFGDATFDGEHVELVIRFRRTLVERYRLAIDHLSAAAYEQLRVAARIRAAEGNPFVEPMRPFSNVEGGVGAFVASHRQALPDLVLDEIGVETLAGRYTSTSVSVRVGGDYVGPRPDSGLVRLELFPDGRVAGRLRVPAALDIGLPAGETPLEGWFRFEAGYVYFDLQPETMLNRLAFMYDGSGRLQTMQNADGDVEAFISLSRRVPW